MRLTGFVAVLFMLGASAPAQAVSETAENFAAAMQGCWNRITWSAAIQDQRADPAYAISSQMCLEGSVRGGLAVLDCGGVNNLVECRQTLGRYEFKDEKVWRSYDDGPLAGGLDACEVRLEVGKQVELHNCQWATPPVSGAAIEDAIYERAIGQ
jgi:hypothetical protein